MDNSLKGDDEDDGEEQAGDKMEEKLEDDDNWTQVSCRVN